MVRSRSEVATSEVVIRQMCSRAGASCLAEWLER